MWRCVTCCIVLTITIHSISSARSAEEVGGVELFQLWNACRSIGLLVENFPSKDNTLKLNEEDIETTIRSRMRGSRIYQEKIDKEYLYAHVNLTNLAFSIELSFNRTMKLPFSTSSIQSHGIATSEFFPEYIESYAVTWTTGSVGTHGGDANYILSSISRHVDRFIDNYLRINNSACQ